MPLLKAKSFFIFKILLMAALALHCDVCAFSSCGEQGHFPVVVCRLRRAEASLLEHRPGVQASQLWCTGCCFATCGTFPDQGRTWVPCIGRQILNHWTTKEVQKDKPWLPSPSHLKLLVCASFLPPRSILVIYAFFMYHSQLFKFYHHQIVYACSYL